MSDFDLIVLGASGTYPKPGGACTGFLLRSGETDVWLDAGPGTFANLQRHASYRDLRALMISHLHIDHITDVFPFYYALRYAPDSPGPTGMEVYAPAGAEAHLEQLVSPTGKDGFGGFLSFTTVRSGDEIKIGPFHFVFQQTEHPIETLAMRIEANGRTMGYTADTAPSDEVLELVRGVDLLVAEASMQSPGPGRAVHMTAEEAGKMAQKAGAAKLVLTHILPSLDPEVSIEQARRHFGGEVLAAADHMHLDV
ncbi:MAG: MBL fold metallo-hydrolase [Actinomycetota bacterium]|nr:MBL fold metallo-hydrolase [Actinomycetota bacterium]